MKLVNREGQSLVEVLIGLAIGALLIGTAALGVAFTLRSSTATQNLRSGSELSQELLDKVRSFAGANWLNIYNLTKGTSTQYFLNASGSDFIAVQGKESKLDNDVLSGLVAHWKFDEVETSTSTTTYDASGNNNNGALTNGTARASSTCKLGNCLSFNGTNNYVSVNDPFTNNTDFTISLWVNTNVINDGFYHGFIGKQGDACRKPGMWLSPSNNGLHYDSWDSTCTTRYGGILSNFFTNTNTWYFIVWTKQGATYSFYKDGTLFATAAAPANFYTASTSYWIGRVDNYWNGLIDDVRIYNRALSSDEIKRLYQSSPFTRYFSVENVCRTNDVSNIISGVAPCAGGDVEDPSTQKITVKTEWTTQVGKLAEVKLIDFITRWQNRVLRQTDWSQGVGPAGPIIDPTGQYSSSSNIDATSIPGSIQIKELTPT